MNFIQFEESNYFLSRRDNLILVTPNTVKNVCSHNIVDSFSPSKSINSNADLTDEVMRYVSSIKLQNQIKSDIKNLLKEKDVNSSRIDDLTQKIIKRIQQEKAVRENYVLANYSHLEDEGNILNIHSLDQGDISIDFIIESPTFGCIVG